MNRVGTALFIFGKIHFLLIPEKEFFQELKRDRMTSFTDFMGLFLCSLESIAKPAKCAKMNPFQMPFQCHNPLSEQIR